MYALGKRINYVTSAMCALGNRINYITSAMYVLGNRANCVTSALHAIGSRVNYVTPEAKTRNSRPLPKTATFKKHVDSQELKTPIVDDATIAVIFGVDNNSSSYR